MSRKTKKRNRNRTSLVGALLIESLAVVVMIGLFFAVQKQRSDLPTVEEFLHPTVIEEVAPNYHCPDCMAVAKPVYSVLEIAPAQVSTNRSRLVSTNSRPFQWPLR